MDSIKSYREGLQAGYSDAKKKRSDWERNQVTKHSYTLGYRVGYDAYIQGLELEPLMTMEP